MALLFDNSYLLVVYYIYVACKIPQLQLNIKCMQLLGSSSVCSKQITQFVLVQWISDQSTSTLKT